MFANQAACSTIRCLRISAACSRSPLAKRRGLLLRVYGFGAVLQNHTACSIFLGASRIVTSHTVALRNSRLQQRCGFNLHSVAGNYFPEPGLVIGCLLKRLLVGARGASWVCDRLVRWIASRRNTRANACAHARICTQARAYPPSLDLSLMAF